MKHATLLTLSFCLSSVLINTGGEDFLSLFRPNNEHQLELLKEIACMHNPICAPQITIDCCENFHASKHCSCAIIPRSKYKAVIDELFYPGGPWNGRADDCETSRNKCRVGMLRQGCNTCTLCSYTCVPLSLLLSCSFLGLGLVDCNVIDGENCSCISSDIHKCISDDGGLLGAACTITNGLILSGSVFGCILEAFLSDATKWSAAARESGMAQSSLTDEAREEA